jgi:16S rRNA (guanine527-N7)-methyltransferase
VLAIGRPDLRVTLVEPLLRGPTFLEEVVDALGLDGVDVVRAGPRSCTGASGSTW